MKKFLKFLGKFLGGLLFCATLWSASLFGQSATKTLTINVTAAGGSGAHCGTGTGQIPCTTGWFQMPNTSFLSLCPGGQNGSCSAVTTAWSSGAFDSLRDRLVFTGGGHTDYSGNEIYYLDLTNLTPHRLTNPDPVNNSGSDPDPSGNPNSRHTYGGLAYIASTDQLYNHAGAVFPTGNGSIKTFLFSFGSGTYTGKDPLNGTSQTGTCCNYQTASDYDPLTDLVWYADDGFLWKYNASTNTQTQVSSLPFLIFPNQHENCAIDYQARWMICAQTGIIARADLTAATPTFSDVTGSTSGCSTFDDVDYVPMAYYPIQKKIVSWSGGNSVTLLDATTLVCTTQTFANGPGAMLGSGGTLGRWRYDTNDGVFVLVNDMGQNAWSLRLDPNNDNRNDFIKRASAPGVIVAQGFDDAGGIPHANNSGGAGSGANPDGGAGTLFPTQDCTVSSKNTCSMHFTVPTSGVANPDGYWNQNFAPRLATKVAQAQSFGTGTTFYVQYRQRMDPNYISNTWSGSFWKMSDVFSSIDGSCSGMEITFVNSFSHGFPQGYTGCGSEGFQIDLGNGDFLFEQGDVVGGTTIGSGTGYNCHRDGNVDPTSWQPPNKCALYLANTWQTYTYKVTVGSVNGGSNSTVNAWATVGGQAYATHQFINLTNVSFTAANSTNGFNQMFLEVYFTGGFGSAPNASNTWFDELIISTQPIAAPNN